MSSKLRKGFLFLIGESYFGLVLQLLSSAIISRLLAPSEFGVYQVAAAFAAIAGTFRDFGVAEYLIQKNTLDDKTIQRALGLNILVSWTMGIALLISSAPLAAFYSAPELTWILRVLSLNFFLVPFGAVTMAWFRREMNFAPLFWSGVIANIVTFSVSVSLAYLGFGAMCLAWSSLAGVVVSVAVAIWFRPASLPRWPIFTELGDLFRFGKHATSVYVVGQLGKSAPEMIIGKIANMSSVAFFGRGGSIVELFHRTVLRVVLPICLPYFAAAKRNEEGLISAYKKSASYITGIGWPTIIFLAIIADEVILILYGRQWQQAVRVGQLICVAGVIDLAHSLSKEALIAAGEVKRSNYLQIFTQFTRVVAIAATAAMGLEAIGLGLILASFISLIASQREISRNIAVHSKEMFDAVWKSAVLAVATAIPVLPSVLYLRGAGANPLIIAIAASSVFALVWVFGLLILRHPLKEELHRIVRRFSNKRGQQ